MVKKGMIGSLLALFMLLGIKQVQAVDYGPHPNETYYVIGCVSHPVYNLYFGSTQNQETDDHDGLVVMKYAETDMLYRTLKLDEGGRESVQSIALFSDGSFAVVLVKYTFSYSSLAYEFDYTKLIKYDVYGNKVLEKELAEKFKYVANIDYRLILSRDETYQADIVWDELFQDSLLMSELNVKGEYTCQYKGKAIVNGESVESIQLSEIGYYHIEITDFRFHYSFDVTVHPSAIGVEEGGHYTETVQIDYEGDFWLDGQRYSSPMSLSSIGYHQLIMEGIQDYRQTIAFVIEPNLGSLVDGGTYEDKVDIDIDDVELTLNGNSVQSPLFVAEPGFYELTIEGVNGFIKTVTFVIYPSARTIEPNATYEINYPVVFIGEAMLNDEWIESGYVIDQPGDYELTLYFGDVPYKTYAFTVVEKNEPIETKTNSFPFLEVGLGIITLLGIYFVFRKK